MATAAVQVVNLHVWYAQAHVLDGVSLHAMPGEIVALLGRKGSGRSMTLRAIFGQTQGRKGSVQVIGQETICHPSTAIAHLGLRFLPAEAPIFPDLTAEENLLLSTSEDGSLGGGLSLHHIYDLCPALADVRRTLAGRLGLARQRMLAIGRVLRSGATVLLLDDICHELSSDETRAMAGLLDRVRAEGYAMILAESTLRFCAGLADRFYVLNRGRVIDAFDAAELAERREDLCQLLCES